MSCDEHMIGGDNCHVMSTTLRRLFGNPTYARKCCRDNGNTQYIVIFSLDNTIH